MVEASPVTVSLKELVEGTVPFDALAAAFGPSSLGIIVVSGLSPSFRKLRSQVLSNASYLASLSNSELEELSSLSSKYLVGWSLGKETLKSGRFDTLKGSYYINCAFHQDPALQNAPADQFPDFPQYTAPNIWPDAAKLPTFKEKTTELCNMMIDIAALVARACDRYAAEKITGYQEAYLERVVKSSLTSKARLLHYFPLSKNDLDQMKDDSDDWCATHVDHSCLTALTSAMFVDEATLSLPGNGTDPLPELSASPDAASGLYIQSRNGEIVKVNIPKDSLAFQTGEALERITKGQFRAVPHFVRGAKVLDEKRKIARNTLAVFTQPNLEEFVDLDKGVTFADFAKEIVGRNQPKK